MPVRITAQKKTAEKKSSAGNYTFRNELNFIISRLKQH